MPQQLSAGDQLWQQTVTYIGNCDKGSLAAGPKLLDLGDVAYAPTIFRDGQGRCLMLAWLQELRKGGSWDYAGCLSAPRVLSLQGTDQGLHASRTAVPKGRFLV